MEKSLLKYITLSWAVVGIFNNDSDSLFLSIQQEDEALEEVVEKYVVGYMAFWHRAFIEKKQMQVCNDKETIKKGIMKIEWYVLEHPPVIPLPKFYIVFLNQFHIGCDADGFSDVFCM